MEEKILTGALLVLGLLMLALHAPYLLDVALIYALLGFTAATLLTRLLAAERRKGEKKK